MSTEDLLSIVALSLLLMLSAVFLIMQRIPGWGRTRFLSLIVFSGALYTATSIWLQLKPASLLWHHFGYAFAYFTVSLHISGWLFFAFAEEGESWPGAARSLPQSMRWLTVLSLLLGVTAFIPGAYFHLEWTPSPTATYLYHLHNHWVGNAAGLFFVSLLFLPLSVFVRDVLYKETGALIRMVGFSFLLLFAGLEWARVSQLIDFPLLAEFGLVAMALMLIVESLRKVMHDALQLKDTSQALERVVADRTRERDDAREALFHSDRLAAIGQLAAGVGHEINNPLTYVRANVEYLRDALAEDQIPSDTAHVFNEVLDGVERIRRVVADLRFYVLPVSMPPESLRIEKVLSRAIRFSVQKHMPAVEIIKNYEPTARVHADALRLSQVFINLISNAMQAMQNVPESQRRLIVSTHMTDPGQLEVRISDNGVGMSQEVLARLSEPYFSTRHDEGGTGLGLFVVRAILATIDGRLSFTSTPGDGTTAHVILPTLAQGPAASTTDSQEIWLARPRLSQPVAARDNAVLQLLIVDDDASVARAISRMLLGHRVTIVGSGQDALDLFEAGEDFDVVLCDVIMPGISGKEVYDAVAQKYPWLLSRFVFVTGGANIPEVATFFEREDVMYLTKPIDPVRLRQMIAQVVTASDDDETEEEEEES